MSYFNETRIAATVFRKNIQISNFMKIRPGGGGRVVACGRTDGRTDGEKDRHAWLSNSLFFSQFCERAWKWTSYLTENHHVDRTVKIWCYLQIWIIVICLKNRVARCGAFHCHSSSHILLISPAPNCSKTFYYLFHILQYYLPVHDYYHYYFISSACSVACMWLKPYYQTP